MESKFKRIVSIVITIAVIMTMTVTPGFAQDAAGEEIIPEDTVAYTYSQEVGEDEAGYNDELFEKYVESQLFSGIEGYSTKKVMLRSVNLSEMNQMIFDRLREQISEVAAGNSTSTVFTVSLDDLGIEGASWTAAELGVSSSATANELFDALMSKLGIDLNRVYDALIAECAYELYWHDKSQKGAFSMSSPGLARSGSGSSMRISMSGVFTFRFQVAEAYSAGEYTVNTENIDRVHTAVENANAAVSKAAILTDDEKLTLYKSEICGLVTYDTAAAEDDSTPYGDQWQLISVFDGDDTTNVVCEGYSKAFKYLCDLTEFDDPGIECILVSGTMRGATGAGAHMWNIVTINGENYLVDVTNCDDGTIGAPDQLFLKGNENGSVTDGYTFTCEGGNVSYAYDEKTMSLYVEELELAKADYGGNIVTVTDGMLYTVIGGNAVFMGYDELLPDHVIIPEEIDGYPVTSIGRSAFRGISDLTQIYIPVGVVFIRPEAFESSGLEKIYYQGTAEEWGNVSKDNAGLAGEVEILPEAELAEGHVYCGEYTVAAPATCTEDGNETRKCRFCEELQTKALPALGHSWGEWTVVTEATASEDGLKRRVCANDASHVEEEVIPKLGNVVTEKYVESMEFKAMPRLRKDVDASLSATAFDGDTVTLNYSDGSSEVYVLNNWNFISQTTETTTDESERISISYDDQNHVDFASYNNGDISLRADDPGASYVAQSIELTSSGPVELIRGLDSVTKTDASGNEYEEYNLERLGRYSKFLENDSFKVTYKNGLDEEITVDYVYADSTGGFTLAEGTPYYTGYPSDNYFGTYFEVELPDQSVDHFEVGQTYYMDVTYHETGSNFDLTPITTLGKPYSLKITQAGPEDVTSISFANSNVEKVKKGETLQLGVNWEPSYAVVPESAMTWTSSNPAVATVDGNGLVTAVSEGSVLITAEINGKKAYKNVEVYDEKVLTDETVSLAQTIFPYTGINVDINQYVLYNGTLVPRSNLSTQYSQRPLNIGDYTATITGVYGGYSGSATKSFTIKGNLAGTAGNPTVTLDPADGYVYSGEPVKPTVTSVTFNGTTLTEGKDYTVSYENNNAAGTGYVVITAVDDSYYMGAKLIPFTITEKGTEPEPEEPVVVIEEVERIYGASRFDTALKVADELKERMGKEKYDAVILAFSHNYADALAGSYLSCAINAPILLVNSKQDNIDSVQSYIKENMAPGGTIYMLGGTAVVPEAAVKGLTGFNTKRLWGKDRYETNVAILKEAAQFTNDTEIIVASGNGFADSLSAAATGKPILLVKNTLQPVQKEYLNSLEGDLVFDIIGGTGAVSDAVMKELNAYGSTNRTGGATRYETSVNVAKKFFDDPEVGVLAYGQDFPDGLCGGALAHAFGGPLILTANGRTDAAVEYANETGMKFGAVLGGPTLISDASAKDIYNMGAGDKIEVK